MKKKLIFLFLVFILSISCVNAGFLGFGDDDNKNDGTNMTLIKNSTECYVGSSSGHALYDYSVKGVLTDLPEDDEGFTIRGLFYSGDKIIGHNDQDLDFVSYSSEKSDPSTIVSLQRYYPVNIDKVILLVFDSEGNVVLNNTIPFDSNNTNTR